MGSSGSRSGLCRSPRSGSLSWMGLILYHRCACRIVRRSRLWMSPCTQITEDSLPFVPQEQRATIARREQIVDVTQRATQITEDSSPGRTTGTTCNKSTRRRRSWMSQRANNSSWRTVSPYVPHNNACRLTRRNRLWVSQRAPDHPQTVLPYFTTTTTRAELHAGTDHGCPRAPDHGGSRADSYTVADRWCPRASALGGPRGSCAVSAT